MAFLVPFHHKDMNCVESIPPKADHCASYADSHLSCLVEVGKYYLRRLRHITIEKVLCEILYRKCLESLTLAYILFPYFFCYRSRNLGSCTPFILFGNSHQKSLLCRGRPFAGEQVREKKALFV